MKLEKFLTIIIILNLAIGIALTFSGNTESQDYDMHMEDYIAAYETYATEYQDTNTDYGPEDQLDVTFGDPGAWGSTVKDIFKNSMNPLPIAQYKEVIDNGHLLEYVAFMVMMIFRSLMYMTVIIMTYKFIKNRWGG